MLLVLLFLFVFRSFLNLLQQDADFHGEHGGEECQEDEEGGGHAACLDVRDGGAYWQQVLDGPRLATDFCYYPA